MAPKAPIHILIGTNTQVHNLFLPFPRLPYYISYTLSSPFLLPQHLRKKHHNNQKQRRGCVCLIRKLMEVCRKMASMLSEERDKRSFDFDETELRLGLPGGGEMTKNTTTASINGKRGFSETVDLKLNLSSKNMGINSNEKSKNSITTSDPAKPPAKAQVVGWPPVRSFRKNTLAVQRSSSEENGNAAFVKVSMDGAPYLRKVDLKMYKSYPQLSEALCKMFSSFTIGNCGSQGIIDFMNESKLMDLLNGSDYVPSYEDKDGDWMLVGDVPWEMFVESCKRLRIMKGTEAIGLAPRAMEKCKNRS